MRKSDMVRELVAAGDYKAALRIAKEFRIGLTKEETDAMKYAYECMVYPGFYKQVGRNVQESIAEGIRVLKQHYEGAEQNASV